MNDNALFSGQMARRKNGLRLGMCVCRRGGGGVCVCEGVGVEVGAENEAPG